ncbi:hypothetical protein GmHk_01G002260 [Glycine max]|nr:hypothetical protein GmHk_01G002260 [Glycine max]
MGTWATLGFICVHEPDMSALLLLQQPNLPYVHLQIIKWRVLDLENSVQKASLVYEVHQNTESKVDGIKSSCLILSSVDQGRDKRTTRLIAQGTPLDEL